jgi:hypothetical protein
MTGRINDHPCGRRRFRLLAAAFAAAVLAAALSTTVLESKTASAATVSFSQCNNQGAGINGAPLSVTCSISIVNTINASGGTSAVVYLRTCTLNGCTGDTASSSDVIDAVHQCNGSDNVGGSTTICSVDIVNNISVSAPGAPTTLTLNQCIGSGGGGGTWPSQRARPRSARAARRSDRSGGAGSRTRVFPGFGGASPSAADESDLGVPPLIGSCGTPSLAVMSRRAARPVPAVSHS